MRCEEIRELIEETNRDFPAQVREHLGACSECRTHARAWRLARGGLRLLAQEEVPHASLGFVARLLCRLEDAPYGAGFATEFLELVGQRVVFATLVLALAVTLVLALPLAGPLRG